MILPYGINIIDGIIYISGQFQENAITKTIKIKTTANSEMFVAALDSNLEFLWLNNTKIHQDEISNTKYFKISCDKKGKLLETSIISEQSYDNQLPIISIDSKKIEFTGKFDGRNPKLIESKIYAKNDAYEYAKTLKGLTEYYISLRYDKTAAGLFAFLSTVENGKITIKSKELMSAILLINPNFKKEYPKLYKNLKDIKKIKSKNNIIKLNVNKIDNFKINGIIIEDNARISIRSYRNGDVQINVLSGISYRPFINKSKINFIRIFKVSGDILINYDTDNDQKLLKLKKNILK